MSKPFTPYTISVDTADEAASLMQLLDAANRHLGVGGAARCVHWVAKMQRGEAEAAERAKLPPPRLVEAAE